MSRLPILCVFAGVLLLGVPTTAQAADGGSELMKATNADGQGGDPAKVRALRELLRQAEKDQAARRRVAADAAAAAPAAPAATEAATGSPPVGAVGDPKKEPAGASATANAVTASPAAPSVSTEGEVPAVELPPPPVARPGCMYSGTDLIWEREPGTCG
jgi:hypothetical protein